MIYILQLQKIQLQALCSYYPISSAQKAKRGVVEMLMEELEMGIQQLVMNLVMLAWQSKTMHLH
jgi:hypothetical protein